MHGDHNYVAYNGVPLDEIVEEISVSIAILLSCYLIHASLLSCWFNLKMSK